MIPLGNVLYLCRHFFKLLVASDAVRPSFVSDRVEEEIADNWKRVFSNVTSNTRVPLITMSIQSKVWE